MATPRTLGDSAQVSYTLTAAATVTATLRTSDGRDVAVLFTQQHVAGKQTFRFAAAAIPEGSYQIVLSATNGKTTVSASIAVLVDRTVQSFAATPAVVKDVVTFSFELTRAASVRLDVAQRGTTVTQVYSANLPPGFTAYTIFSQSLGNSAGAQNGRL